VFLGIFSMTKAIDSKIRQVLMRCAVNVLLKQAGIVLFASGILAMAAVLAQKLLALDIINPPTKNLIYGFAGATFAAILLLWYFRRPGRMQVSLLLDERMKLKERFSTALAFDNNHSPFADAARDEAVSKINNLSIKGHFPIRLSGGWAFTAGIWLAVYLLVLFLPQKDLLGFLHKRNQQQQLVRQTDKAKADVNSITKAVALAVRNLAEPNLVKAIGKLDQMPANASPEDIRREAIRKLGDLSEKIKNMQNNVKADSAEMLQQMLKQLRGSPEHFSQKLRMSLAKGDFAQASKMLEQLQEEMANEKVSEQQKQEIASQLQELGKQLKDLAERNNAIEKELEGLGLDKELTKMSPQQLRQELMSQGLNPDAIETLVKKAEASQAAAGQSGGLGNAMAACGGSGDGLSEGDLAGVMEQLDQMDAIKQQLMQAQFSQDEIQKAIASLGQGQGQGSGQGKGKYDKIDSGGGHGEGIGLTPGSDYTYKELPNSATVKTRTTSKVDDSQVVASWYIKDTQIKGQAVRDYADVIQAGRDSASEAISENEIPRKYEEAIKKYFGRLEQAPAETTEQPEN
jgi:hypothetical protein